MRIKSLTLLFLLTAALAVGAPAALGADTPALLPKLEPITAANASRLQPIAMLGVDVLHDAAWSPDGETLALVGTSGLWRYHVGQPAPERIEGYTGLFRSAAYSPDGKQFVTGSDTGRLRLWDAASWQPTDVLQAAGESVEKLAYSPDGSLLAAGFADGYVHVWDMNKRTLLRNWKLQGLLTDLTFSPDGAQIAVSATSGTVIYTVMSGEMVVLPDLYWARTVAFSPDGKWLAVSNDESPGEAASVHVLHLWNRIQKRWVFEAALDYMVAFDHDNLLLTNGHAGAALWRPSDLMTATLTDYGIPELTSPDQERLRSLPGGDFIRLSPDNSKLAVLADTTLTLVNFHTGATLDSVQLPDIPAFGEGQVYALAFSPTEPLLAFSEDSQIRLWDTRTGNYQAMLSGHELDVIQLAFSGDGQRLASASTDMKTVYGGPFNEDGSVRVWDVHRKSQQVLRGYEYTVDELALNVDGTQLFAGAWAGDSRYEKSLWRLSPSVELASVKNTAHLYNVAFSPTNPHLAAITYYIAGEKTPAELALWNPRSGQLFPLEFAQESWSRPLFSANGRLLFASSGSRWMLWNAADRRLVRSGEGGSAVGISPRGKTLALRTADSSINFVDTNTFEIGAKTAPIDYQYLIVEEMPSWNTFTSDGTLFLTRNLLIDVKSGQVVARLRMPNGYYPFRGDDYFRLYLSADNRLIAVTKGSGVRLWGVLAQ
jgi:WD40 repeat protein